MSTVSATQKMWADRASRFVYFISPYFAWIYKIFLWILSVVFSPFIVPIALVGGLIGAGIYDVYQDRPADKQELAVALQDRCVANELVTYKRVIAKRDISRLTRGCKRSREAYVDKLAQRSVIQEQRKILKP